MSDLPTQDSGELNVPLGSLTLRTIDGYTVVVPVTATAQECSRDSLLLGRFAQMMFQLESILTAEHYRGGQS